tara:strand:- start:5108 stop:5968 length:861 start_codon:yes stop_codon:yes gene_type:complete
MKTMKPKEIIKMFIDDYGEMFGIDKELALIEAHNLVGKCNRNKYDESLIVEVKRIEKEWYDALMEGDPDYSCYDDDYYFIDLITCFVTYSRSYLRTIENPKSYDGNTSLFEFLGEVNKVADLGCGMGYTSAYLKEIWPNSEVYGTNIKNTKQYQFCEKVSSDYDFSIVEDTTQIGKGVDFVFASEYFEHFENPMEHLDKVIEDMQPNYLFLANSFNTYSIGHFTSYKHGEEIIPQKFISRAFNNHLSQKGYQQVKTKVWNNKPALWVRNPTNDANSKVNKGSTTQD